MFDHLFSPLNLRHLQLRSRLVFGAHTANMASGGLPGERHLGYYEERARGGAAMIVVEPVPVHASAVLTRGNFLHDDDAVIPGFRRITEACHGHGAVMIQQLYHVGQHGNFDNAFHANWSPSGRASFHDSDGSHAMSDAEIETVIEAFVAAARRARDAGFDGVELFAAYHGLIDQFWSPWSNRRDDRWGGSLENRLRLSTELTRRIRRMAGDQFIIGMAVSVDAEVEAALSLEALQEIAAWHDERALVDYFTCGTGSYFDFYPLIPTALYPDKLGVPYAEALKQVVAHARVQAESHIRTAENADYVIAAGQADMVSIVRGQIADPHLGNKAREGRAEEIRPCLSCNQMCWGRRARDYWISCLVNPSAGREFEWGGDRFTPTMTPRRVFVVGGGPAGLEAARVAAERGHRVVLAEAMPELGGRFRLAGLQPRRGQIIDLLGWYESQLERLQVELRRNTFVDAEDLDPSAWDVLIVATGSSPDESGFQRALPHLDSLPGIENANVWSVDDVLSRNARPGARCIVLDDTGHWHAAGTALYLAERGHAVTLVTRFAMVGWELIRTATDWPLRRRLQALRVTTHTDAAIERWHGDGADIVDLRDGSRAHVATDALIIGGTGTSRRDLADALAQRSGGPQLHVIGDALAPRLAVMAIYEARKLAREL